MRTYRKLNIEDFWEELKGLSPDDRVLVEQIIDRVNRMIDEGKSDAEILFYLAQVSGEIGSEDPIGRLPQRIVRRTVKIGLQPCTYQSKAAHYHDVARRRSRALPGKSPRLPERSGLDMSWENRVGFYKLMRDHLKDHEAKAGKQSTPLAVHRYEIKLERLRFSVYDHANILVRVFYHQRSDIVDKVESATREAVIAAADAIIDGRKPKL